ncbi:MAG: FAD-dependent oxidoreductase [Gammaproteobacteria bacterium]|nr:FAD-dependent oxidoreductase [Gammaproteobacteria bacterium]
MRLKAETDIAIIGGGIAGLWLLNRLRQQGYSAVLLESGTLGGGQTHKAQGIIHGGMKYALQGAVTPATKAIAAMPDFWQACLTGNGTLDLRAVPILSDNQYLWTTGGVAAKVAGFFAGLTLRSELKQLTRDAYPAVFQHPEFRGDVYVLDEKVIDVHALIRELVKSHQDAIFHIDPPAASDLHYNEQGAIESFDIHLAPMHAVSLFAKKFIFAAGSGNDALLAQSNQSAANTQRRPLHMVMVKHHFDYPVYAHCVGLSSVPRMTITTHRAHDGKYIWYIGGQIAEEGVHRDTARQCEVAKQELQALFPWLDFSTAAFASFPIDRAEAEQPGQRRPDSFTVKEIANYFVAWPTKLAFAPLLAENILQKLDPNTIRTGRADIRELRAWPIPAFAKPMWEQLFIPLADEL